MVFLFWESIRITVYHLCKAMEAGENQEMIGKRLDSVVKSTIADFRSMFKIFTNSVSELSKTFDPSEEQLG